MCLNRVLMAMLAGVLVVCEVGRAQEDEPRRNHVVFVIGEDEYHSERTLPELADELRGRFGLRCTVLIDRVREGLWEPEPGQRKNDIPGLEALDEADVAVFYLRFRTLPETQLAHIQRYLDNGGAVVGLRTSTHAFRYAEGDGPAEKWNAFGARVLGAPWIHHYGHTSTTEVSTAPGAAEHPILRGVDQSFRVRSWLYHVRPDYPPASATVLLNGRSMGPGRGEVHERAINPVAWTMTHPGGGRVFTTTMGHPEEFEVAAFRRLLINGILWAMDRPVPDALPETRPARSEVPPAEEQVEVLDVMPVWSAHPVGFSLLTHPPLQFVAFYDAERHMTVAARKLGTTRWHFVRLPSRLGWDSHNSVTMAVDDDGYIHLTGNMHGHPLLYFRTARPLDIDSFERVPEMVGRNEQRCTYPEFLRDAEGRLLFTYRDGGSGRGDQIINVYDPAARSWDRLLDEPLISGGGTMNAYPVGPVRDDEGWFHLCWVWRDTPDCATNHDLSYARSRDLIHWETSTGEPLSIPITFETGEIVDPVPAGGGIINGNTRIGFDTKGRVILSYHKFDDDGNTQLYSARLEDGAWTFYQTSDWDYRWEFSGGGTIPFEISFGPVTVEPDGHLSQRWRHVKHGSGTWELDEATLKPIGRIQRRPVLPAELRRVQSEFPGMSVRTTGDLGESGREGVRYLLRWETLGPHRDRPREGDLPEAVMLRLCRVPVIPD